MGMTKVYDLFPFSKVPKDAEIVIWGAGKVGRQYCEQINSGGVLQVKIYSGY